MKLILLAVVLAVANGKSVIFGDEECAVGPSYWCKNVQTARQCNGVKYCAEHVWMKQFKATSCDACKRVVGIVHSYLADNTTETEVLQALEAACSFLGSFASECKQYVEAYGKEVIELLAQYTANSTEFCTKIGLCKSQALPFLKVKGIDKVIFMPGPVMPQTITKTKNVKSGELCEMCVLVVGYVDSYLKNNGTEQEVIKAFDSFCSMLPSSMASECTAMVNQYVPIIIATLAKLSPELVCKEIGLCTSKRRVDSILPWAIKNPEAGELCAVCKMAVGYVDKMLKNNATEKEIIDALDSYCNVLPQSMRSECTSYVSQYVPIIIETLETLSPELVCKKIGLCTSERKVASVLSQIIMKKTKNPKDGELCEVCEMAVGYVDKMLKNNATEKEIIDGLDSYCNVLPQSMRSECTAYVSQYVPIIIETLEKVSPALVCKEIGLCTSKTNAASILSQIILKKTKNPKAGELCAVCKMAVGYVDKMLKNNATEKEIIDGLDSYCNVLPQSMRSQCTAYVSQYVPIIIATLEKVSPELVCKEIGLCTSKTKAASVLSQLKLKKTKNPKGGELCSVCEMAVGYVDKMLKNNATEKEIIDGLDSYCNVLPQSMRSECTAYVNKYVPLIIETLEKVSPALVCKEIGLCTSKTKAASIHIILKTMKNPKAGELCTICEMAVGYVDNMLKKNSTEKEILDGLDSICNLLPVAKTECTALVNKYVPVIIATLEKVSPELVCKEIGLCTSKRRVDSVLPQTILKKMNNPKAGALCMVCEVAVGYVDKMLKNNATEKEIIDGLNTICNLLPAFMKSECSSIVNNYVVEIIKLLATLSPDLVCKELKLCTSEASTASVLPHTILKKMNNPKGGEMCWVCEMIVAYIDKMLKNNATETEVIDALESFCDVLPGSIKTDCTSLVNNYVVEIIKLLATLSPDLVCQELGLCTSEASTVQLKKPEGFVTCELCELAMGQLDTMLLNNEAAVINAVDKVCSHLPVAVQGACDSLVKTYGKMIIEKIVNDIPPVQICKELKLCTSQKIKTVRVSKPQNIVTCELCELAMGELDKYIGSNATEQEIIHGVETVCGILPSSYKAECNSLIETYGDKIIKLLINEIQPAVICKAIGLCSAQKINMMQKHKKIVREPKNVITCEICDMAIGALDKFLGSAATEQKIISEVEGLCSNMSSGFKTECDAFITAYGKQIIELIINNELDPAKICTAIKLCSAREIKRIALVGKPKNFVSCEICELAIGALDKYLGSEATEEKIINEVEHLCSNLSSAFKTECDALISEYGKQIIELLITKELVPADVCKAMKLCPSRKIKRIALEKVKKPRDSFKCTICKLAMGKLDTMLESNATQQEIFNALDKVCSILPSTYKAECDALIKTYGKQIINILAQEFTPNLVCTKLGLCSQKMKKVLKETSKVKKPNFSVECIVCEFAMKELESMVTKNSTEQEIITALDKVCSFLPSSYQKECDSVMETYGKDILNMLLQELSPKMICTTIGLCSQKMKTVLKETTKVKKASFSVKCVVCELVMKELKSMVTSGSSENEMIDALDKVCSFLPSSHQKECTSLVNEYGKAIINLLMSALTPDLICKELGLCTSSRLQNRPKALLI